MSPSIGPLVNIIHLFLETRNVCLMKGPCEWTQGTDRNSADHHCTVGPSLFTLLAVVRWAVYSTGFGEIFPKKTVVVFSYFPHANLFYLLPLKFLLIPLIFLFSDSKTLYLYIYIYFTSPLLFSFMPWESKA